MPNNQVAGAVARLSAETPLWQTFLLSHRLLIDRLSAQMLELHDLPLSEFDVLIHLAQAPGRRLRQAELRDSILLSESGLSRLLGRMDKAGLVTRSADPTDRRGVIISLAKQGERSLVAATMDHLDLVSELFSDVLEAQDRDALSGILTRLISRAKEA